MEKEREREEKTVVNHFEAGSSCQVFNGDISGCVFAMPGSNVTQQCQEKAEQAEKPQESPVGICQERDEELCHFIHPSVDSQQEWHIHDEVKRLASRQGIQEICRHLQQMRKDHKVLLPQAPSIAYMELVRMGMPCGEGFNESTFRKYYSHK